MHTDINASSGIRTCYSSFRTSEGSLCLRQHDHCDHHVKHLLLKKKKLRGLSPQVNYTDRATAAVGEVLPAFAGRGCYVVSATDSHGRSVF
jgi:hypothetical protein